MKHMLSFLVGSALLCALVLVAVYETLFIGRDASEQTGDE